MGFGGYYNTSYLHRGRIQDLKVYKGVAKYTADFTLPTRNDFTVSGLQSSGEQATVWSDYLKNLNKAQKDAVMHLDGPLLIVAGAGSGKTKVLISRIAHIIAKKKAYPNQILAVTFTNKAAKEMRDRVLKILGGKLNSLSWLGTFHAISVKFLRRHAEACLL